MPTYMKAYRLADLERYARWQLTEQARSTAEAEGLGPDSIVYLRGDLAVVSGCFGADPVLFQSNHPEWRRFCRDELDFEVPDWEAESIRIRERLAARKAEHAR
jgi:hypothetical protein